MKQYGGKTYEASETLIEEKVRTTSSIQPALYLKKTPFMLITGRWLFAKLQRLESV